MSPEAWGNDSRARLTRLYRFGRSYALALSRRHDGYGDPGKAVLAASRIAGPLSYQATREILSGFGSAEDRR